ncbi:hypothetical protein [Francisella sp. LA112445]|uniref:hypothetical protein n=1 Tax=Francisella sp. LA112445 TaxID=1395624 RepID=UPI001788D105|nr:hypothetical protein [Francisella sp. LA112445]QIW10269.1 hypothetical protein FIP56_06000 [Francisella sp. LA112445]
MKKAFKGLLFLAICLVFSSTFATTKASYTPYEIGQSLGKISHKSFKSMKTELSKKDFIAGFNDTILDKKPDINNISDQDSYEVGMIIATQYKSNLKKLIKVDKKNSQEFVKGFDSAADTDSTELTAQDKQILAYFKKSDDTDD